MEGDDADYDPAADFLAREAQELSILGDEEANAIKSASKPAEPVQDETTPRRDHSDLPNTPITSHGISSPLNTPPIMSSSSPHSFSGVSHTPTSPSNESPRLKSPISSPQSAMTYAPANLYSDSSPIKLQLEDSLYYREWSQRRSEQIREREKMEAEKHDQIVSQAQKDIEKFYADYNKFKAQLSQQTRESAAQTAKERAGEDLTSGDKMMDWHDIYKLLESVTKSKSAKDTSRMVEIIRSLDKKDTSV